METPQVGAPIIMDFQTSPIGVFSAETRQEVEASLVTGWRSEQVREIDDIWSRYLTAAQCEMTMRGVGASLLPDTIGWSWYRKFLRSSGPGVEWECHSIQLNGFTQGLIVVSLLQEACRAATEFGNPCIEVVYLAASPWNIGGFMRSIRREPFLANVGITLMRVAVERSCFEGCQGRLRLYSVPKAERFYSTNCGMIDLGLERHDGEILRRFEMTCEQAAGIKR